MSNTPQPTNNTQEADCMTHLVRESSDTPETDEFVASQHPMCRFPKVIEKLRKVERERNAAKQETWNRMARCMEIQNAKNEGSAECAEWIAMDRELALKTALNQVTAGIGIMVIAGVDPWEILTRWMDAVERNNSGAANA